jgi:AraC-like DNA-binding protein
VTPKTAITGHDANRERAARAELVERITRHVVEDGRIEAAPGLFLFRYSAPTGPLYSVSEPSFCVIVQGSKELFVGDESYRYDATRYLLVSAEVPAVGHIVDASADRPYLAVRVALHPAVVTTVLTDAGLEVARADGSDKAIAVSQLDMDLLDAVVRLVRLVDSPRDYEALAPLAAREIVYRLARGDQGRRLRQIAVIDGRAHRIARAIELVRRDFDKPLHVSGLARQLGMSVSGLHHQFKAVTAMSPLQFQKHLRLEEARRLLLTGEVDAATAGYEVGYDDPSHFSREYKRHFGQPPIRDVERLRAVAVHH